MKRMPYIIISVAGVLLAAIIFAGCSVTPSHKNFKLIAGVSLSQSHMNFGGCYNFFLREEEGKVLFDAEVRLDFEPYVIILESCSVDKSVYTDLIDIVNKYSIADYVEGYRKMPDLFQKSDGTVNKTTVYYNDGTDKSADSGEYSQELYEFFLKLAIEYKDSSVAIIAENM